MKSAKGDTRKLGRISLDVDETIADVNRHIMALHNSRSSTRHQVSDLTDWGWSSVNITDQQFYELYNAVWRDMSHKIGLLVDKRLLYSIAKHYEIDLVTMRGRVPELEDTVGPLRAWLERHGVSRFRLVISSVYSQKDVLGYDIYIDDSPVLAQSIAKSGKKVMFLVDKPHNRSFPGAANVRRVSDVNEALRAIAGMKASGLEHE